MYGDTIEEAKANAKDTIEAFLGDFADRDEAFPEPSNAIADDEASQVFEITVEVPTE
jgi:predicted RNase H-like HicB family nuclease